MASPISSGDEFVAGGTSKVFKVTKGPDKDGYVTLKEQDDAKNVEETVVHEDALKDSPDWIGVEVGP